MKKIILLSLFSCSFLLAGITPIPHNSKKDISINKEFEGLLVTKETKVKIAKKPVIVKTYIENNKMIIKSLEKLIKERKFYAAEELFNSLDIDMPFSKKQEYKNFFKIVNSFSKEIKVAGIEKVSKKRTIELLDIFFIYFDSKHIKDKNYVPKMISFVERSNLDIDNKMRYKARFYYLSGKATTALKLLNNITKETKDDRIFKANLYKFLTTMQDIYYTQLLHTDYKKWAISQLGGAK